MQDDTQRKAIFEAFDVALMKVTPTTQLQHMPLIGDVLVRFKWLTCPGAVYLFFKRMAEIGLSNRALLGVFGWNLFYVAVLVGLAMRFEVALQFEPWRLGAVVVLWVGLLLYVVAEIPRVLGTIAGTRNHARGQAPIRGMTNLPEDVNLFTPAAWRGDR